MAYHFEKNGEDNDLVIDGFEKGIADSPELGMGDMRSVNITSIPGEASVSFATAAGKTPPSGQTGIAFTGAASSDTLTVAATTNYYNGMAIKIASTNTPAVVNTLIVAGGGAGASGTGVGGRAAGGGGAGGVNYQTGVAVAIGAYPVVVGAGGGGGGLSGADSSFNSLTATGGGGGGSSAAGSNGGSGGGGSGTGSGGTGVVGQGNNGGAGGGGSSAGGGGGGAGAVGAGGTGGSPPQNAGGGGNGISNSITGAAVTYGGGGGGGATGAGTRGTAGTGGGGAGADNTNVGVAGTDGLGGGGGGASDTAGKTAGNGGNGVVIISYTTGLITATGGTITTSGSNTIHTFSGAGTGTFTITAVNLKVSDVYYIGSLSSTTFKLYYDPTLSHQVDILSDMTGTYDVTTLGTPVFSTIYGLNGAITSAKDNLTFMVDNTGNVWFIPTVTENYTGGLVTVGAMQWLGNTSHSTTGTSADFGIAAWNGYLLVFIKTNIDYISLANIFGSSVISGSWVYAWKSSLTQTSYEHMALAATDGNVYICNGAAVASLVIQAGQTFNPTNSSTYTWNVAAIPLPATDVAVSIGQISAVNTILIGGSKNIVYVFDSTNPGGGIATELTCADSYISRIVGTNSTAYVFAGQRGRIYITGGGTLQLYKKIPDNLSGNPEPYYTWQDAQYFRNKIYFTFTATDNSGASLSTMGGIWTLGIDNGQTAIQLPTAGSLYNCNQFSYGTYGGSCPCLFTIPYSQLLGSNPPGYGVGGVWVNSSIVGIDVPTSLPYTGAQCYIDSDIIPVGTYGKLRSYRNFEYKLAKPLVAGESVTAYMRSDLSGSFTQFFSSTSAAVSDMTSKLNFEKVQWIQFRVSLASTATTPSYNRLTQIRIR